MGKVLMEDCRSVSIYKLKEWGCMGGYHSGLITWTSGWSEKKNSVRYALNLMNKDDMYLELSYLITGWAGEKLEIKQKYPIASTPCNLGGMRYWIRCSIYANGHYCGKRVAKIYLGAGSHYFACRHCYNLSYESRNLSGYRKAMGAIVSIPDIDEAESKIKRKYYAGKKTRQYEKYLAKEERFYLQMQVAGEYLAKK